MFDSLRRLFSTGSGPPVSDPLPAPPEREVEDESVQVPELGVDELRALLNSESAPMILDVREPYEWKQVRIADNLGWSIRYIAMNSVPEHLAELPNDRMIAVLCAHGSRSYGVAHYLIENGFSAVNVTGGITRWTISGGAISRS
jgi:rhodanese-related sulfurtransferase